MVETRLAHSANRSGTNNVELSPVGDYRRGDCLAKQLSYCTVILYYEKPPRPKFNTLLAHTYIPVLSTCTYMHNLMHIHTYRHACTYLNVHA